MNKRILLASAMGAAAMLGTAQQAQGQAWIGQIVGDMMAQQQAAENTRLCRTGSSPVEKEIIEAQTPANATMQAYFAGQQNGTAPRSSFFAIDKHTAWSHDGKSLDQVSIDQGTDGLAAQGNVIAEQPYAFYRSFLHARAIGQWPVRDEAGNVIGVYNGFFVRRQGDWILRKLTLEDADDYSGPVEQFCDEPGDVLTYRIESSSAAMEYHDKRRTKAYQKLESERETLAKREARLAKRPNSQRHKANVQRSKDKVSKWQGEIVERQAAYDAAKAENDAALAERDALPAKIAAAKAELGITS